MTHCPTCDHAMQKLQGIAGFGRSWFWCPRCGTIQQKGIEITGPHPLPETPKIAEPAKNIAKAAAQRDHADIEVHAATLCGLLGLDS